MNDRELYQAILGLTAPWQVREVKLKKEQGEVSVFVEWPEGQRVQCPECGAECSIYDRLERSWRHLDTCQFKTMLIAKVPRANCSKHGATQIKVPWAEKGSRFTALFEAVVIHWRKEASLNGVAEQLKLSWDEVFGIEERAVKRGMERRKEEPIPHLGVDEKAFTKGHKYVTITCDIQRGRVLDVIPERKEASLAQLLTRMSSKAKGQVEAVAMDMWEPYVQAVRKHLPNAAIVFDKFHVAKHLNEGVDKVRRRESKELAAQGDNRLKGTKYKWLKNPKRFTDEKWREFQTLRQSNLKVARAYAIKETAKTIWDYTQVEVARQRLEGWYGWAIRSRLEPMKEKARLIKSHAENVLNYIKHRITNAMAESLNSKIQWIKYTARGYRNQENFRNAILFHCGGLDLEP